MSAPFENIHHLCIVVRDMDRTVAFYEAMGIGPWHDYPPLSGYTDLQMPDLGGFLALRYKYVQLGQLQLQMAQPGQEDTPQRRFLDDHGEGVFHIGFSVADADRGESDAKALGLEVLMRGRRPDASGFTYYDTAQDAGGVLLLTRQSSSVA
jgi:catechol 2,3-dioxygenase-like lactoylglutathione lyase family enzyme